MDINRRELLKTGLSASVTAGGHKPFAPPQLVELTLRTRDQLGPHLKIEHVDPRRIGVLVIDVWNYHWCRTWRNRAASLVPRFNHSLDGARQLGMTIVFSPTNAMRDLNAAPQRRATLELPDQPLPTLGHLPDPYPESLRFSKCECGMGDECVLCYNANNQHPGLRMSEADYIALTQQEAFNIFRKAGTTHIIYTGFATNICVWNKPTGAKYMRQLGFRCMLARDLTEAMTGYAEESFNPTLGTIEVIELIERDLLPSISMEETLKHARVWQPADALDFVHLAPWGRLFGGGAQPVAIPIQVELTCRHHPEAELRYTLNGTDPSPTSALYRKSILIEETTTLKAAGFKGGSRVTRVSEAKYWKHPSPVNPPDVFVSDLKPLSEMVGEIRPNSYAMARGARLDKSVIGRTLSNRDNKYFKGIGVQSPSKLVFHLLPEYCRFVALAAADDECTIWDFPDGLDQWPQWSREIHTVTSYRISHLLFQVWIDGRMVYETPPLFNGDRAWSIDVTIPSGSREITLAVEDVDSELTDPHGHADWLNAGFVTAKVP